MIRDSARRSQVRRRREAGAMAVGLVLLAALSMAPMAPGPAGAQDETSYMGSYYNWEGHIYRIDEVETRCAVRALHPAILEAEIYWVFNTLHSERLPNGFLAVDRRIADGAAEVAVVIDRADRFVLRIGEDGHGYNRDADAARLIAAMRRGVDMEVIVDRRTTGRQRLPVSLLGFTRGSNAARAACAE